MNKTVINETIVFENESGIKICAYINHDDLSYNINPLTGDKFDFKSQGNREVGKVIDKQREVAKMIVEVLDYIGENMGLPVLNYQCIGDLFIEQQNKGKRLELIIVNKKVSFNGNTASFNNSYFCSGIVDGIVFESLEHNNTGKNFKASGMY